MERIKQAIKINEKDLVAVALEELSENTEILGVTIKQKIPRGHKFALLDIEINTPVIKYGYPIGISTSKISKGEHVHTHNIKTLLSEHAEYEFNRDTTSSINTKNELPQIQAFRRKNGDVGIRNELWIIPTVGCVNKTAEIIAKKAEKEILQNFPAIDGIHVWTHPYGCSQMGTDHETTQEILADLAVHPNAAGVLILGLGCENNTVASFKKIITLKSHGYTDEYQGGRIEYLIAQESSDEITDGLGKIQNLCQYASQFKRESINANELIIGMKCGGSDGLSGITANPLVGQISDFVIAGGGSVILTEVPEMFGAEQILMNRSVSEEVYSKTVDLINNFKDYYVRHDQVVYENPSPGNKDGGISTLEDKSLGCIQKGGSALVTDVILYGQRVADSKANSGLYLLEGPGNDIVSTTAMTAAGAHLILFTTGRGTPLGAPVPTLKIATNKELATHKSTWIDFDASKLLEEDPVLVRDALFEVIIKTASGEYKALNEQNDYREIAILKEGVTL